jgi:hypothetical protein
MKTILLIIASILIVVLVFAWYIGYFTSITPEERIEGGYTVAGLEVTGPYSKSGKSMQEVMEKLKNLGVECTKSFGIYYDDPKTTPADKCRSFVGGILEEKDLGKLSELKTSGLKVDSVARVESVVAEFPLKNSFSYMIGPMKAYPAISKYLEEKKYKVSLSLEVYDPFAKKITYIMQYSR